MKGVSAMYILHILGTKHENEGIMEAVSPDICPSVRFICKSTLRTFI